VKPGALSHALEGSGYMEAISRQLPFNLGLWLPPPPEPPPQHAFAFINIADWLLSCVKIHLWFFNMLLRGLGIGWASWVQVGSKSVLPKRRDGFVQFFQDSYDKDNPVSPYSLPTTQAEAYIYFNQASSYFAGCFGHIEYSL
jgi:hypothetical protein